MYNAVTIKKIIRKSIFAYLIICTLYSCGNNNHDAAIALYNQAESYYNNKKYNESNILLDSLKNNYTDDIALLKKGLYLRTLNQEGLILEEISQNDSLISVLEEENKNLSGLFTYIKHPDMVEGYYIHKSIVKETEKNNRVAIEPRIDENDMFYLVSYLTGHDIKHTSIKISSKSGSSVSSATVPYDEAQNYRYNSGGVSYEIVTYNNNQCDTLGYFVNENNDSPLKITFQGKKSYSIQINKTHINAVAETYRYAVNKNKGKSAIQRRMYLEQKLELAKKQINQTKPTE